MSITGTPPTPDVQGCSSSSTGSATSSGSAIGTAPAVRRYASPLGNLVLIAGPAGLAAVLWPDDDRPVRVGAGVDARTLMATETTVSMVSPPMADGAAASISADVGPVGAILDETVRQLDEYFAGIRHTFDLALDPTGTEFQVAVWRSLAEIGYGETATYGQQASRIGRPTAVRAVGAANGRNPLSIVLPCHRVVGSDGRLTGFAGGLEAKAFLLDHEARNRPG